jgi:hypothetical protein
MLWYTLLCILAFVYWRYCARTQDTYEIIQVTPSKLSFEIVNALSPVVIELKGNSVDDIVGKSFRYMYTHSTRATSKPGDVFTRNRAMYCILGPVAGMCETELVLPHYVDDPNYQSISIILEAGKTCVMVPYMWGFRHNCDQGMRLHALHNLYSSIAGWLGSKS